MSLLVLLLAAGCWSSKPRPVDPSQARAALESALDAWKEGKEPTALQHDRSALHVSDHEWSAGWSLVHYEVLSETPQGSDLRCQVRLTLRDDRGRSRRKLAIYGVATSPALTVLRSDEEP
jgi:hypothetical protein